MPKRAQTGFEGGLLRALRKLGGPQTLRNTNPSIRSPKLSTGIPPQQLNSACVYTGLVTAGTDSRGFRENTIIYNIQ